MNLAAAAALSSGFSLPGNSNSNGGSAQFEVRVGPFVGNELTVIHFAGRQALNEPFLYNVLISTTLSEDELRIGTRGLPACLSIHNPAPHEPTIIQGLAVDLDVTDTPTSELAAGRFRYVLYIAPRLSQLDENNARRRIFQNKTAIEIVCAVLKDNGIEPDVKVRKADYAALPFEYQKDETDLAFVTRVLATAGIFFYFRHATGLLDALVPGGGIAAAEVGAIAGAAASLGGPLAQASGFISDTESSLGFVTTLVLADRAAATEQLGESLDVAKMGLDAAGGAAFAATTALGGALGSAASVVAGVVGITTGQSDALTYDANGQAGYTDVERVFSFSLRDPLVPKQVRLRHWNVKEATAYTATAQVAPVTADLGLNAIASISLSQPLSLGLQAGMSVNVDSPSIAPSEASLFEYNRDPSLQNAPVSRAFHVASRALAQARSGGLPGMGTTDCRRLAPGYRFTLQGHPVAAMNGEYLVTEIRCEGTSPDHATDPKLRAYQCSFRCVPSRMDPLPKKPPPVARGPEPATVIGPKEGDIYCDEMGRVLVRLRWMQGNGFSEEGEGICRVHLLDQWGGDGYGMQAIPRVGSEVTVLYFEGGEPFAIGQNRSRQNRPAFNSPHEVTKVGLFSRVIPNGGASEISIDDDPDRNQILVSADGDFVTAVRGDTTATLMGNFDETVGEERRELTSGSATLMYDDDLTTDVLGDHRDQVAGDRIAITEGAVTEWVGGAVSTIVAGSAESVTQGDHHAVFEGDSIERHYGHHAVVVAAPGTTEKASAALHVEGAVRTYAKDEIEIASEKGFTLRCGDSLVAIRKDSITFSSPTIKHVGDTVEVMASDTVAVVAKTATVAGSDSVTVSGANKATLAGQSATVILDSNATVQGSKVKLGSGAGSPSSRQEPNKPKKVSTIELSDTDGNPLANQWVILRKGGEERVVVLDADGAIDVEGDDPFDVFFPDAPDAKS